MLSWVWMRWLNPAWLQSTIRSKRSGAWCDIFYYIYNKWMMMSSINGRMQKYSPNLHPTTIPTPRPPQLSNNPNTHLPTLPNNTNPCNSRSRVAPSRSNKNRNNSYSRISWAPKHNNQSNTSPSTKQTTYSDRQYHSPNCILPTPAASTSAIYR